MPVRHQAASRITEVHVVCRLDDPFARDGWSDMAELQPARTSVCQMVARRLRAETDPVCGPVTYFWSHHSRRRKAR